MVYEDQILDSFVDGEEGEEGTPGETPGTPGETPEDEDIADADI